MQQQLSSAEIVKVLNTKIEKMKYPDLAQFVEKIKFILRALEHATDITLQKLSLLHNRDFYQRNLNRKLTESALRKNELWKVENLVTGEQTLFGLGEILNIENYSEYIHKIGVAKLPQALKDGHSFFLKNREHYDSNESIKETIIDYLSDLNHYVSKLPESKQREIFKDSKGYSGNKFTGTNYKYVKGMPIAEIAKLVREELKVTFGDEAKFTVRTDTFSGGRSLDVKVVDLNFDPYAEEYSEHLKSNEDWSAYDRKHQHGNLPPKYNERATKLLAKVKGIVQQYNYDDSNSQIDYFSVSFYDHEDFDDEALIKKFYPDNIENNKRLASREDWKRKSEEANQRARERKGSYAKNQPILYMVKNWRNVPDGEYKGVVTKAISGQSRYGTGYTVQIAIGLKKEKDGTVKPLAKVGYMTIENVSEKQIRPDDALTELAKKRFNVGDKAWFRLDRDRMNYSGDLELKKGWYPVTISKRIKGEFPVYQFEIQTEMWNTHHNKYFPHNVQFWHVFAYALFTEQEKQEIDISEAEAEALAIELELLNFKKQ